MIEFSEWIIDAVSCRVVDSAALPDFGAVGGGGDATPAPIARVAPATSYSLLITFI